MAAAMRGWNTAQRKTPILSTLHGAMISRTIVKIPDRNIVNLSLTESRRFLSLTKKTKEYSANRVITILHIPEGEAKFHCGTVRNEKGKGKRELKNED